MAAEIGAPRLVWNPLRDVGEIVEYHFMVNALLAGSVVAVVAGLVGWLMLMRREAFAGHTLSLMAFPGAGGAALIGVPAAWGYFAFSGAGALGIARLSGRGARSGTADPAGVGAVQSAALAAGFLFVSLYGGVLGDLESLLFGNLLAVSDGDVLRLGVVAVLSLGVLAVLARPLLFASVDPEVARARGVPVRALSIGFLLLLALAVAATSQITGPLLVFTLLVMPAASAQAVTVRPALSLVATVAIGLLVVWLGTGIAYFSVYPAGFFITVVSFAVYLLARGLARVLRGGGHPTRRAWARPDAPEPPGAPA